jgi:hypothetical protein
MRTLAGLLFILSLCLSTVFAAETMDLGTSFSSTSQIGYLKRKTRKVAHRTKRGAKYAGRKTVKGTRWTAHKTKRGTKKAYVKSRTGVRKAVN